jgi:tight adherence protein B
MKGIGFGQSGAAADGHRTVGGKRESGAGVKARSKAAFRTNAAFAAGWRAKTAGLLIGASLAAGIGYLFYKSWLASIFLMPFGWLAVPGMQGWLSVRQRRFLAGQFRQFLYAFSTSLSAGRSVENALLAAERDLAMIDPSGKSLLFRELSAMNGQIRNGLSAEKAFARFAERVPIQEAAQFSAGFSLCKQTGGDLVELVRRSAALIGEKIEMQQEMEAITAQKRFEAKAMAAIPFALIAFLAFGSPDYMAPLYGGMGRLIMTAVLLLLAGCHVWISRLMRLEV